MSYQERNDPAALGQGTESPLGLVDMERALIYSANIHGPSATSQASRLRAGDTGIKALTCGLRW